MFINQSREGCRDFTLNCLLAYMACPAPGVFVKNLMVFEESVHHMYDIFACSN